MVSRLGDPMTRFNCVLWRAVVVLAPMLFVYTDCGAGEAPDLSGRELYQVFCASCHGVKAHGDGPVAKTLKPRVPDLTRIAIRNGGAFPTEQVRQTIDGQQVKAAHGTRDMPVWDGSYMPSRARMPRVGSVWTS